MTSPEKIALTGASRAMFRTLFSSHELSICFIHLTTHRSCPVPPLNLRHCDRPRLESPRAFPCCKTMGISLAKAQLLSLGLTTFLYGASTWNLRLPRLTCIRAGLFFTLFLISTAVMSLRASEDIRVQRNKILPVSSLMLVVATLVRAPQSHGRRFF
jgi:hypothetical protein